MALILGIETSCDETAAAVYDDTAQTILSHVVYSQTTEHLDYGGIVPEIASRTQLERIDGIVAHALHKAGISLSEIDTIGVTNRPGLVGSLLVGVCFAKGLALAAGKKLVAVDHLEGHIFSSFLTKAGPVRKDLTFPFLCMSVSGGHTSLYLVHDFGEFELLGQTIDDAAGEALDKTARLLGYSYPGGPKIEALATEAGNVDYFSYPRNKNKKSLDVSFSGLKTAVLYDLVKKGMYDLKDGRKSAETNHEQTCKVASSLQVCMTDIFAQKITHALDMHPTVSTFAFVGGVSANKYITHRLSKLCASRSVQFIAPPLTYCGDNGAMIAYVAAYKAAQQKFAPLSVDVYDKECV
jgi:N6-L-threonylcarbamoyladenine synthase